jgi:hypothetical protein
MLVSFSGNTASSYAYSTTVNQWPAVAQLTSASGSRMHGAELHSESGNGMLLYYEYVGSRYSMVGRFLDAATGQLSAGFVVDDPRQSPSDSPQIRFESSTQATIVFNQQANPLPPNPTNLNSNNQRATRCVMF